MSRELKNQIIVFVMTLLIFSLFCIIAYFENNSSMNEIKEVVKSNEDILVSRISNILNYSIGGAEGVVSFIQTYPDLNQDDFSDYVSKVLDNDNAVVSHLVAIKDTTIAFSYPLAGNESGIGVDLLTIEDQKDQILQVKNQNVSMLVGPIELVEGGVRLINRMPIYLDEYWGQLSVIIRYEEMLNQAGIKDLSTNYYIEILQADSFSDAKRTIYSNYDSFSDRAIVSNVDVPNGQWSIKLEPKVGFSQRSPFFYAIIIAGLIFSALVSFILKYIMNVNANLNKIVDIRTNYIQSINEQLEASIGELKATQEELIEKEKLAALGSLVAGVAHEINTPVGISITAASYIEGVMVDMKAKLQSATLKKSDLIDGITRSIESADIIETNLNRATKLISDFKLLATDNNYDVYKEVLLKDFINYIIYTIGGANKSDVSYEIKVEDSLKIETYPAALTQVLGNLINNSLVHAFKDQTTGLIEISAYRDEDHLVIDYKDNGIGINEEIRNKIFQPFFTTKRTSGNTGLGMHIVYNIVHHKLQGNIVLKSSKIGLHYQINLPLNYNL